MRKPRQRRGRRCYRASGAGESARREPRRHTHDVERLGCGCHTVTTKSDNGAATALEVSGRLRLDDLFGVVNSRTSRLKLESHRLTH